MAVRWRRGLFRLASASWVILCALLSALGISISSLLYFTSIYWGAYGVALWVAAGFSLTSPPPYRVLVGGVVLSLLLGAGFEKYQERQQEVEQERLAAEQVAEQKRWAAEEAAEQKRLADQELADHALRAEMRAKSIASAAHEREQRRIRLDAEKSERERAAALAKMPPVHALRWHEKLAAERAQQEEADRARAAQEPNEPSEEQLPVVDDESR